MGESSSKQHNLQAVQDRVVARAGSITAVSGRYKKLPIRIEDDYEFPAKDRKVLGTGFNGAVFQAKSKDNQNLKVAVKQVHLRGLKKEMREFLHAEVEVSLCMDHPNVCRLVDVYECDTLLNLVMECMEGGELLARVQEKLSFTEVDAAHAAWQMLLAVAYLHKNGIVHRDLKLENFLYDKKDSDQLKLIDFGFSHFWDPNTTMAACCGTLSYMAPEVLKGNYTSKCDLWSLGIIVFILLAGYMPFSGSEEHQVSRVQRGMYFWKADVWKDVSEDAIDFVKKLLKADPEKRMTIEQALAHPFIKNHEIATTKEGQEDRRKTAEALVAYSNASHFRQAVMTMMAWSLTSEERAQVNDCFLKLDCNNSGTITIGALKQVLQDNLDISDANIKPIFDALKTSNTEEINYSEFLAAMVSARITMHDELLAATFSRFDVDNTGTISRENLKAVLGDTFNGSTLDELIAAADGDGSGDISYDEFIAYLKNSRAQQEHSKAANQLIDKALMTEESRDTATPEGWGESYLGCRLKKQEDGVPEKANQPKCLQPRPEKVQSGSQCCIVS